jgi:hypothetical protein
MISADVFFIAVETSLPLGRAVSYLSAIGESLDFILFEMSETMSFFAGRYSTIMLLQILQMQVRS